MPRARSFIFEWVIGLDKMHWGDFGAEGDWVPGAGWRRTGGRWTRRRQHIPAYGFVGPWSDLTRRVMSRSVPIWLLLVRNLGAAILALGLTADMAAAGEVVPTVSSMARRPVLNEDLKTVFLTRPDLGESDPSWIHISGHNNSESLTRISVARVMVQFLNKIACEWFPRCETHTAAPPPGTYDLLLTAEFSATLNVSQVTVDPLPGKRDWVNGLVFHPRLQLASASGEVITAVSVDRYESPAKQSVWSMKRRARSIADRGMTEALHKLVAKFEAEASTKEFFGELERRKARPPGMHASVELVSENLLDNRILDAGERVALRVAVVNEGPGPAYDVRVTSRSSVAGVESGSVELGVIEPAAQATGTIDVRAPLEMEARSVAITIAVDEGRGYSAQPIELRLGAAPLRRPRLEIVDIVIDDAGSRSIGDGDGRPGSGETFEIVFRILNEGEGPAIRPQLSIDGRGSPGAVVEGPIALPGIAVGELVEGRVAVELPPDFSDETLDLSLRAVDARGPDVAQVSARSSWDVVLKRPNLRTSFRLFDGNSSHSRGNRDGRANNGEVVEVSLVVTNRGTLVARDVTVEVNPRWPGLAPSSARLAFGDIPPAADSAENRFVLPIPRQLSVAAGAAAVPLAVRVGQRDFEELDGELLLPFSHAEPLLETEVRSPSAVSGLNGEISVRVANRGSLSAENVRLELQSISPDLLLLDDESLPTAIVERPVGTVSAAGSAAVIWQLRVKSGAREGEHPLRLLVHHDGYPVVVQEILLPVVPAESRRVAISPAARPSPSRELVSLPATVSFISPGNGEHITAAKALLVFEVHHLDQLAEVRILANDRRIDSPAARPIDDGVSRYEVVVPLDEGENLFEVVVLTRHGVRTSHYLAVFRPAKRGELWVASVGISDYEDPQEEDLLFADQDAEAVDRYYAEVVGVPQGRRFLLTNEKATLGAIKTVLGTELPQKVRPDDTVVLFFAGHGKREQDHSSRDPDGFSRYLLPFDGYVDDLFGTALRLEDVEAIVRRLRSRRVVVLIDSCFSGGFGRRADPDSLARSSTLDLFLDRLARSGTGRVVITASRSAELALERAELGHGVFTYSLLRGLHGEADEDGSGDIDTGELFRFVSRDVAMRTRGAQNPVLKAAELVGRIIVGGVPVKAKGEV